MKSYRDFNTVDNNEKSASDEYSEYLRIYYTGLAMQGLIAGGLNGGNAMSQKEIANRAGEIAKMTLKINMP